MRTLLACLFLPTLLLGKSLGEFHFSYGIGQHQFYTVNGIKNGGVVTVRIDVPVQAVSQGATVLILPAAVRFRGVNSNIPGALRLQFKRWVMHPGGSSDEQFQYRFSHVQRQGGTLDASQDPPALLLGASSHTGRHGVKDGSADVDVFFTASRAGLHVAEFEVFFQ